jgi:murein DD-endopeptidase MepM/ murein hydrolase activator NlpD
MPNNYLFKIVFCIFLTYPSIAFSGITKVLLPTNGFISSNFGYRTSPLNGQKTFHEGYDIAAPVGTPVFATVSGKVKAIGRDAGYGRYIMIESKKRKLTILFGHLKSVCVREGMVVKKGTRIGAVGMTGRTTGPHLHYEVRYRNSLVSPKKYTRA